MLTYYTHAYILYTGIHKINAYSIHKIVHMHIHELYTHIYT